MVSMLGNGLQVFAMFLALASAVVLLGGVKGRREQLGTPATSWCSAPRSP